jgi:hypothetical protein
MNKHNTLSLSIGRDVLRVGKRKLRKP